MAYHPDTPRRARERRRRLDALTNPAPAPKRRRTTDEARAHREAEYHRLEENRERRMERRAEPPACACPRTREPITLEQQALHRMPDWMLCHVCRRPLDTGVVVYIDARGRSSFRDERDLKIRLTPTQARQKARDVQRGKSGRPKAPRSWWCASDRHPKCDGRRRFGGDVLGRCGCRCHRTVRPTVWPSLR